MSPRGPLFHHAIAEETIVEAGFLAVESALKSIEESAAEPVESQLHWYPHLEKYLLDADRQAQKAAEQALKLRLHDSIEIRGEESSLKDFTYKYEVQALLDMLDGSDLWERGFGNWCSAMTLFNRERVWASFIGMPNREIYYERYSEPSACVREPRKHDTDPAIQTVTISKPDVRLRDASVCFYGQKPKSFLAAAGHSGFLSILTDLAKETGLAKEADEEEKKRDLPKFRMYNLAGNPMMMKLVEGQIHAVIELSGQKCHDIIPGFSIALKAGAVLFDLGTSQKILSTDLAKMLASPNKKYRYVMACNESLAREVLNALTVGE